MTTLNYDSLQDYNLNELKAMAKSMALPARRRKQDMVDDITLALKEYEEYKRTKLDKYKRIRQLGSKGKEGITYLVVDEKGNEYAMKTFRRKKSSDTLRREYSLQEKAASYGIAPSVVEYDTVSKYIVMEKMDQHLVDVIAKQRNVLYRYQQRRILHIFRNLDKAGVYHDDCNLMNYMLKGKEIYLIDFGFAREITPALQRKLECKTPNETLMTIGFILKLVEHGYPPSTYDYLLGRVSDENKRKFNLESVV